MIGLGGSSLIQLGIAVRLHNHFSSQAAQVVQSMNRITGSMAATRTGFQFAAEAMRDFGYAMTAAGGAIVYGYSKAISEGSKFQDHLITTRAIMNDTSFNMAEMSNTARKLSREFPISATEMAEGMKDLAKAGLSAKEIPDVLRAIAMTATAADEKMSGVGGVSERFVDMMKAWGLTAKDAMAFADVSAMTSNLSTIGFSDLFEAMKYSQSTFMSLKIPLEDAMAMIGSIGSAGLKGSMGGTSLSNTMRFLTKALTNPTSKQEKGLAQLGLSRKDFEDATTGSIDLLKMVELLSLKTKGLAPIDRKAVLENIFGERGSRIQPLIDQISRRQDEIGITLTEFRDRLVNKSGGEAGRISKERMTSYLNQAKLLTNALVEFKITVFEAVGPAMTKIVTFLTKVVQGLNDFGQTFIGKIVIGMVGIVGVVMTGVGAFNLLTSGMILFANRFLMAMGLLKGAGGFGAAGKFGWFTSLAQVFGIFGRGGGGVSRIGAYIRLLTMTLNKWGPVLKGLATGAYKFNSLGKVINALTGRFVTGTNILAAGGLPAMLARLAARLAPLISILGTVGRAFSIIGVVSLALSAMGVSLRNQFRLLVGSIKWVIGTISNILFEIISWIPGVKAWDFTARQKQISDYSFGTVTKDISNENAAKVKSADYGESDAFMKRTLKSSHSKYSSGVTSAVINVHVDGKQTMSNLVNLLNENSIIAGNLT
jgi:TP901 family phage tail tape measure protein